MGDERPAFKTGQSENEEDEGGFRNRLSRARVRFRDYVNGLEWPGNWPRRFRLPLLILGGAAGMMAAGLVLLVVAGFLIAPAIPARADLYALNRPGALTFKDEQGDMVGVRGAFVGDRLKLAEMPAYLPAAFLAMEDRKFYSHHGVDPAGLLRAAMADFKAGHIVQGGSTITQQVVKIVLLSPDRTFWRKLRELAGAFALESRLSKDQILELYLNRIYLGSGAYGVDGAARIYFGKSAREATLSEAAMLAALTSAPSAFSPRRDLAAAQTRAGQVLAAMVGSGAITKAQAEAARARPATIMDPTQNLARDYFLDAAADEVRALVPSTDGDLTVTTTMDPSLQEAARTEIASVLGRRAARTAKAGQAALVAMEPDGAVRALIGGRDYAESTFNRATKAHRQPGSAFKPFVYLAALEQGLTPSTVRVDQPIAIKNWAPENYTEDHVGPVTLHQAFARSINTIAIELGQEVGMPRVVAVAQRLGIQSKLDPVPSLALGTSDVTPLELTAAYASFATLGNRVRPYMVIAVQSPNGSFLYRRRAPQPARVLDEKNALLMNAMMYEVVQSGTGTAAAVPGHEVAGKTGTSEDYRDAWFVGFSPQLIAGVWVGNDDYSPMKKVTGGTLSAQIWSGFMRTALKNVPPTRLPRADPPPPVEGVDIAATGSDGDNAIQRGVDEGLNGIGSFFNRLFGGGASSSAQTGRPATEEDGQRFFPEEGDKRYSMDMDDPGDQMPPMPVAPSMASTQPEQLPPPARPNVTVPEMAPPPPPPPDQRAGRQNTETFVFQNGDTGERYTFRTEVPPAGRNDLAFPADR